MPKTDHAGRAHAFRNPSSAQYWMECDLWSMLKRIAEEENGGPIEKKTVTLRSGAASCTRRLNRPSSGGSRRSTGVTQSAAPALRSRR